MVMGLLRWSGAIARATSPEGIYWEEELRMQRIWKYAACAAAILLVAPGAALAQQAKAPAKATAGKAKATSSAGPRARSTGPATLGGHPNLNGVWQVLS